MQNNENFSIVLKNVVNVFQNNSKQNIRLQFIQVICQYYFVSFQQNSSLNILR